MTTEKETTESYWEGWAEFCDEVRAKVQKVIKKNVEECPFMRYNRDHTFAEMGFECEGAESFEIMGFNLEAVFENPGSEHVFTVKKDSFMLCDTPRDTENIVLVEMMLMTPFEAMCNTRSGADAAGAPMTFRDEMAKTYISHANHLPENIRCGLAGANRAIRENAVLARNAWAFADAMINR